MVNSAYFFKSNLQVFEYIAMFQQLHIAGVYCKPCLQPISCGFRKKKDCSVYVAKPKVLSLTVTAKLICAAVLGYEKCRFSHDTLCSP